MITLMFIGLTILPICALVSGALFFAFRNKTIHVPSFLLFGFLTLYVDLSYFHRAFKVTLQSEVWGPAAEAMSLFTLYLILNSLAFGLVGAAIYSLFSQLTKKQDTFSKLSPVKMVAIAILAASTATLQTVNHHQLSNEQKLVAEAKGDLTQEQIENIFAKNIPAATTLVLLNPTCPEKVLREYAQKDVMAKTTVLKNPNLPAEVVETLAKDPNEVVRYQAVLTDKISTETLKLLINDTSKDVRKKAEWALKTRGAAVEVR
jgi:hypothetical protein